MRRHPTPQEDHLWQRPRDRSLRGLKFRRQHCIGRFIVDFYCPDARVVVEIDGGVHELHVEDDRARQEYLESLGLRVLRFPNNRVDTDIEGVLREISEVTASSPACGHPLSARGEGDRG